MGQQQLKHLLELTGSDLSLEDVRDIADGLARVKIADSALGRMKQSFLLVKAIARGGTPTYGISTGFGELSRIYISEDQNLELQLNLIRSHASGVGKMFPKDTVRAIMLLRLNALCVGYSGINPQVACLLAELINCDITPMIPEQGSLGASGDLANLAHMSLVLVGEGEAVVDGEVMSGDKALRKRGLSPVQLRGKDGLALINGTSVMLGLGALACL
ncbi:MAG TPA: aromatic amino acid lyase, partial [Clostridia bacterium]|nr:aromatic amino acid lyase [Clostridia bacterium]